MWKNCRRILQTRNLQFVHTTGKSINKIKECKPAVPPCEPKVECLMDLLPLPDGCWKEQYDRQNQKANLILFFGAVNFITAFVCHVKVGVMPGYPKVGFFERFWENLDEL